MKWRKARVREIWVCATHYWYARAKGVRYDVRETFNLAQESEGWYFMIHAGDKVHNSAWNSRPFKTAEAAMEAAERSGANYL